MQIQTPAEAEAEIMMSAHYRTASITCSYRLTMMSLAKKIYTYLKHSYDVREALLLAALCYWLYFINRRIFHLYVSLKNVVDAYTKANT